jgi:hypothetical protein
VGIWRWRWRWGKSLCVMIVRSLMRSRVFGLYRHERVKSWLDLVSLFRGLVLKYVGASIFGFQLGG